MCMNSLASALASVTVACSIGLLACGPDGAASSAPDGGDTVGQPSWVGTVQEALATTCSIEGAGAAGTSAKCSNGCVAVLGPGHVPKLWCPSASPTGAWTAMCATAPHRKGDGDLSGGQCWNPPGA